MFSAFFWCGPPPFSHDQFRAFLLPTLLAVFFVLMPRWKTGRSRPSFFLSFFFPLPPLIISASVGEKFPGRFMFLAGCVSFFREAARRFFFFPRVPFFSHPDVWGVVEATKALPVFFCLSL